MLLHKILGSGDQGVSLRNVMVLVSVWVCWSGGLLVWGLGLGLGRGCLLRTSISYFDVDKYTYMLIKT